MLVLLLLLLVSVITSVCYDKHVWECPECGGTGVKDSCVCPHCQGTGKHF